MEATTEIFRPKHCPECDYSMEGLGAEGRCPECGWAFTTQDIVLYGQVHQVDGSQNPREPFSIVGYLIIVVFIIAGVVLRLTTRDREARDLGLQFAFTGAIMLPLALFIGWRAKSAKRESAGPWQLRVGPAGWGIRFGTGPLNLNSWEPPITVEAQRVSSTHCLLSIVRTKKVLLVTLQRRDVSIGSAAIIVKAELLDLVPVVERVAGWLGTSVERRLNDRKEWIIRAKSS